MILPEGGRFGVFDREMIFQGIMTFGVDSSTGEASGIITLGLLWRKE